VTAGLTGWLGATFTLENHDANSTAHWLHSLNNNTNGTIINLTKSDWIYTGVIGGSVGICANIVHYVYAACVPVIYIKCGILIAFLLSIAFSIAGVIYVSPLFLIFPGILLLVLACYWCFIRPYIPLSASILQVTARIICRFPGIILVVLVQAVITIIGAGIPLAGAVLGTINPNVKYAPVMDVYFAFSFLWISITLGYVTYLTLCGVGATWYFLNDTNYMPASPTWESFKRAWTSSFGSAALVGFLLAVIQLLKALMKSGRKSDNAALLCLRCCVLCILNCLESCIKAVARYALIYCATFGVPFTEGCRRWAELGLKKFVDCLITGNIIGESIVINWIVFSVGSACLSYGLAYWVVDDENERIAAIIACVLGLLVSIACFAVLSKPIQAISDTLLICFAEAPEQLQTSASDLHLALCEHYKQHAGKDD
jgi:hypothetical protein